MATVTFTHLRRQSGCCKLEKVYKKVYFWNFQKYNHILMISPVNSKKEKKVLQKMVLMYIHENIDDNIKNTQPVNKIIEEVVKELLSDMDTNLDTNIENTRKPIYIEMPVTYQETRELIRPSSPVQCVSTCNRQLFIVKIILFFYNKIMERINNQEFYQRYQAISSVLIELFRVITSSLMIVFVPQKCGDHICTMNQTILFELDLKGVGLSINILTLFSFICMYLIEIWRENRLIKYLDVNPNMPNDSEYITSIMNILPHDKKEKILHGNLYYMYISYITIIIYIINAIISGIIINKAYLSNQTYATFITYVIFMITKLTNSYTVANTSENVFYSAYLKTNVQFNDIDRNYKKVFEF